MGTAMSISLIKKYFVLTLLGFILSCNKDEGNNPIPDLTVLKFKRINVYQGAELIRYFEPEYSSEGNLRKLIMVNANISTEKYADSIVFDGSRIRINFQYNDAPSGVRPYSSVIFHHTNGRLDSIIYNDILTVPPISPLIRKHVFEYNADNRISREYDFYFFENDTADIVEYKNHQVVNGRLMSVERFGPDESYEKLEYTYSANKDWITNGFNLLNFFYRPTELLYYDAFYLAPLFFNQINFKGNSDANAVITQERLSGYFFFDGVKNEYDRIRSMDYVFDEKGRITEMNSMQAFSNRIKFEYFD
jgi:hypothetical protein